MEAESKENSSTLSLASVLSIMETYTPPPCDLPVIAASHPMLKGTINSFITSSQSRFFHGQNMGLSKLVLVVNMGLEFICFVIEGPGVNRGQEKQVARSRTPPLPPRLFFLVRCAGETHFTVVAVKFIKAWES